jgi:hypothetical protein
LDEWIREQFEGKSSASLPLIANAGVDHFIANEAFLRVLYGEQLRALIYNRAKDLFRQTRPGVVDLDGEMVDREEVTKRAERLQKKWTGWLEHTGDKVHVRLFDMNRAQLLTAAAAREADADVQYKRASFLRELADGLNGRDVVSKKFTPEEVEAVWTRVHGKKASNLGEAA